MQQVIWSTNGDLPANVSLKARPCVYGSDNNVRVVRVCCQFETLGTNFATTLCGVFLHKVDEMLQYTGLKFDRYDVYP